MIELEDPRTKETCGDCMWLILDLDASCWEYCYGEYKVLDEDNFTIVGRCPDCKNEISMLYKNRHKTICQTCLTKGLLIHIRPVFRKFVNSDEVAVLKEDYLPWEKRED